MQLLPEAKQTSWQVFILFLQAVNGLENKGASVSVVTGQSENAGAEVRAGKMLVKVLKWICSEAQDGKDIADHLIGKGNYQVHFWVKNSNAAVSAYDFLPSTI